MRALATALAIVFVACAPTVNSVAMHAAATDFACESDILSQRVECRSQGGAPCQPGASGCGGDVCVAVSGCDRRAVYRCNDHGWRGWSCFESSEP